MAGSAGVNGEPVLRTFQIPASKAASNSNSALLVDDISGDIWIEASSLTSLGRGW